MGASGGYFTYTPGVPEGFVGEGLPERSCEG